MSEPSNPEHSNRLPWITGLLVIGWIIITGFISYYYHLSAEQKLYHRESQLTIHQVETLADNINRSIDRLKGISVTVAHDKDTLLALQHFGTNVQPSSLSVQESQKQWSQDKALIELNYALSITATNLEADSVFILNTAGDCIAASTAGQPGSPVGTNFRDRAYFPLAKAGQPGHLYAVGRTTKVPGLYFTYPVFEHQNFMGVAVVKRNISNFRSWIEQVNGFISDANGVVILATDKSWENHSLPAADALKLTSEQRVMQYAAELKPLAITPWEARRFPTAVTIGDNPQSLVLASKNMPENGITLHVSRLLPDYDIETTWFFLLISLTGIALIVGGATALYYLRERRKTEEELRSEKKRLQDTLNELKYQKHALDHHAIVSMTDVKGDITYANEWFSEVSGYSNEELIGKNHRILLSGVHSKEFFREMYKVITTGGVWKGEVCNRAKDGSLYWVKSTVYPFLDDKGKPTQYISIRTDITDLKKAEAALRESTQILNSIIENLPIMLFLKRASDLRMTMFNKAGEDMLGYSREELIGKNNYDCFPKTEANFFTAKDRHVLDVSGFEDIPEETITTKDGRQLTLHTTKIALRDDDGLSHYLLGISENITERKIAQQAIILARDEANQANQTKSEFLSSMSHELRTPLNAILGFGQLIESNLNSGKPIPPEFVTYILASGNQLLGLINQVLDLSRLEIGKMEFNIRPVPIKNLVLICVEQVISAMTEYAHITFYNNVEDTTLLVQADDQRLRQVLINLLSNAAKYNKQGGTVTVNSIVKNDGRLRIEIRDTGLGIAKDKLHLLFTPFERLDQIHGTISGVGIGLHITKQLMEAMNGTVGADSVEGEGSTFWFEIPLMEETPALSMSPKKSLQQTLPDDSSFVVLYVEDNPMNIILVQNALQSHPGIKLLTATTGEEGLITAEREIPNLILMDIKLPGIDGITATSRLKEMEPTGLARFAGGRSDLFAIDLSQ